jgi:hypothetical protein
MFAASFLYRQSETRTGRPPGAHRACMGLMNTNAKQLLVAVVIFFILVLMPEEPAP